MDDHNPARDLDPPELRCPGSRVDLALADITADTRVGHLDNQRRLVRPGVTVAPPDLGARHGQVGLGDTVVDPTDRQLHPHPEGRYICEGQRPS